MSPERRNLERRKQKERDYLRSVGLPALVDPSAASLHARDLNARGMAAQQIADLAGVSETTVSDLIRGTRSVDKGSYAVKGITREGARRILSVRYTQPGPVGALVDAVGTRRRVQALMAAGWPTTHLSRAFGVRIETLQRLASGAERVRPGVAAAIEAVYDKLAADTPETHGATQQGVVRSMNRARVAGYAPPHCWDTDTIDDPEAHPEWTGACGSSAGLSIHYRDRILPACPRCLAAGWGNKGVPSLDPAKVKKYREARGLSQIQLADELGVNKATPHHWETGRSRPQSRAMFDRLLAVLDVNEEEVAA